MSQLYPGGCRIAYGRIFSPEGIKRLCSSRDHSRGSGNGSIADQPHKHEREIARRRRQQGLES